MSDAAVFTGRAAVRAGILVTGTEVLTGIISDRNGPWLSERLLDLGVDVAMIEVVGDRPEDLLTALEQMAAAGVAVIVTSGGLGPTADDLTAEIVGALLRARDGARRARSRRASARSSSRRWSAGPTPTVKRCAPPTASRP